MPGSFRLLTHGFATVALLAALTAGASLHAAQPSVELKTIRDITYLSEGRQEKLDVFLPASLDEGERLPLVIYVHGGGWSKGDKANGLGEPPSDSAGAANLDPVGSGEPKQKEA